MKNIFSSLRYQIEDPLKVLDHVSTSDFMLCSTFHGVIMALISRTPFLVVADKNLLARLTEYQKFFSNKRIVNRSTNTLIALEDLDLLLNDKSDIDYKGLDQFVKYSIEWYSSALHSAISLL